MNSQNDETNDDGSDNEHSDKVVQQPNGTYRVKEDTTPNVNHERMQYFWMDAFRYKTVRQLLAFAQTYSLGVGWLTRRQLAHCLDMDPQGVRKHMDTLLDMGVYEERTSEGKAQYRPNEDSTVLENFHEIENIIKWNLDD